MGCVDNDPSGAKSWDSPKVPCNGSLGTLCEQMKHLLVISILAFHTLPALALSFALPVSQTRVEWIKNRTDFMNTNAPEWHPEAHDD